MKDGTEIWKRLLSAAKERRLGTGVLRRTDVLREHFYRWAMGQAHRSCHTLPCISFRGDFSALPASVLLKQSLNQAVANIGGPPDFVGAMDGMSGQKYRTSINNFVRSHTDARYLEIGSWQRSTAAASLYGNSVKALCIDNWSQLGGLGRPSSPT